MPQPGNPLDWDRYAYVRNSPVNYTDPSGNRPCDGNGDYEECNSITPEDYNELLYYQYRWNVIGHWTMKNVELLIDSAIVIENSISGMTNGNGRGWMLQNLSGVNVVYNNTSVFYLWILDKFRGGKYPTPGFAPTIGNNQTIYLNRNGINSETIIHELGHIADNLSKKPSVCSSTWCGGGASDDLARYIGVNPRGIRWANNIGNQIPEAYKWESHVKWGYGNTRSVEYFAEAFYWSIIDPSNLPNASIYQWVTNYIKNGN